MNERIKELAKSVQCERHWTEEDIEKFAELLLQDVMSICEEMGDKGMDGHYCVDKIRKEFAV